MTPPTRTTSAKKGLHELFLHGLQDIYDVELKLTKAIPKMLKKAKHPRLKEALETHLEETKEHVKRVEKAFAALQEKKKRVPCKGIAGVLAEGDEILKMKLTPEAMDAGIILAAQKVEHYEISSYGALCEYAKIMGHDDALDLLKENMNDEENADQLLSDIAESGVNEAAKDMEEDDE
jgi:ferritin-like metal-binding protein YciE